MSHKIHITLNDDWQERENIELNINRKEDISAAGIIDQINFIRHMGEIRNELKMIQHDMESDPILAHAFSAIFKNKKEFAKFKKQVKQTYNSNHYSH